MKKTGWVIVFLMVLASCQDVQHTQKPDNLISENKMVEVLTEISLLHGARSYNKNVMEEKGIVPYPYLMEKYGIDSAQLVQSNNYYAENYRQYNRIYGRVKQKLEILLKEYDSIREIEERKRDSIKALEEKDSLDIRKIPVDSLKQDSLKNRLPKPVSRNIRSFKFRDKVKADSIR